MSELVRAISLLWVLPLLLMVSGLSGCTERESVYVLENAEPLTEAKAIELSRMALHDVKVDGAQTVPYVPADTPNVSERIFARTEGDPNHGYVLWKMPESKNIWDYRVTLVRGDGLVKCKVTQPK